MDQATSTAKRNGHDGPVSLVIEEHPAHESSTTSFYDPGNPDFAAPKEVDLSKKRGRKRRLATATVILLLVLGGLGALYLLLRVRSVNVKVQADPRRNEQRKPDDQANSNRAENGLTAEAINIARTAAGSDGSSTASPSPTASPASLPFSSTGPSKPNYSATDSPVFAQISVTGTKSDTKESSQSSDLTSSSKAVSDVAARESIQSRSNATQTLFVDDQMPRPGVLASGRIQIVPREEKRPAIELKTPAAVLPAFGTMLPVRTQGVIFTLRNNSYARLELTRDSEGVGWSLPKGTILVGRVSGGEYDRAFVSVIGYLDSRDNKLVKITGEVLGSDGASGIQGKRVVVNQDGLKRALRRVASSGLQVAGMMAGALAGRGTVVIDSAGYRLMNPMAGEASSMMSDSRRSFVKVEAGRPGYVMVADLPKIAQAVDAPGEDELTRAASSLTDRDVMELILFGSPEEIRAAMPLMTDEQKRLAAKSLNPESEKK